jgi:molecular chaperone GrpE (heat shock protein)
VKQINPLGEQFDPKRDEAIESIEVEKADEDDKILAVASVGYELHGKIIRHTKVKVGKYKQ